LVLPPLGLEPVAITSDQFIVQFNPGVSQADIDTLNADNGVAIMMPNPYMQNEFLLKVTNASDVDGLKMANRYHENSLTDYAHPNFIVPLALRETIPDDPLFANQWHHQNSGASGGTVDADVDTPLAWDITLGRNTTVIAVIDDGFDMGHPDLTPNYDTGGWDFTGCDSAAATLGCGDSDPSPGDGEDHGTAVAGVAAARGGNGIGVSGSCPNCRLMPLRRGNSRWADALAFDYARTSGAHIITNSWGYALDTVAGVPNVIRAINRAANAGRGGLGSVIFFAMSNANWDDCIGGTPDISSRQNVIAISASSNFDRKVRESAFGNCMDLLAPTHRGYNPPFAGTLNIVTTDRQGDAGYNNSNPLSGCPSTEPGPPPANARDYTFCFRGTSSATPLVAGVAGLILSAEPDLTRLQVQRVLQDTTDKIEPGTAVYSDTTGFSSPPTGQASHGYGRVNAFEAVRVVAPVANDGKGGVDIFMRDNRLDWGNTTGYLGEQPSSVLFEPTRGFIPWYESVDIKVDSPAWGYQPAPVTSADFDAFEDEAAMSGEMNRVYVRVRNRGPAAASAVQVKLHWVFAGTGLPRLPSDFWTRFPNNSADTSRVHPLGVRNITNLTNSGSSRAGRPGDTAQIVQFDFRGPDVDPGQPNPNHFCLFAVIDSPQDPIDLMSKASLIIDHIVPNDNNITLRNIGVIDTSLTRNFEQIYFVRNPTDVPLDVVLRLRNADILQQGWTIGLDNVNFNQPFSLQPDEERLVTMKVTAPELGATGEVSIIQEQAGSDPLIIMGGMTYRFAPRTATSPSLNVTPISGLTETVVTLTGIGYQPGGYVGAVRWDEADIDTLFIADGGVFTKTFTIPADASAGPHTITVCAGNPCYSGEFEQTASFTFIVTDPHAGMKTTLWHAWQGDDKTLLEQLAADFQGGDVQLVSFDTKAALLEALSDAANSTNPDLILGPDMWSDELTSLGLAEAYCLPGQCPQCEGPNPPPWCTYGKGDFSYSRNNDFLIAGLCEPDQCPVCYEPNPPRWCWAAQLDPVTAPDIFQTGFADLFNNEILPFGIPISWEAILVLANPAWFVEHEQSLPNDVDEIIQLHDIYPDLVYVDPSLIGPQAEPPANAIGKLLDALNGSPNPDPAKGGLYVVQLDQFPKFWADTGPLFLFPLTDYQPELMVQGVYVNPLAEQKEPALNFVHLLANEETQIKRFQTSGHLPAHGQAWEPMANETLVQFGQQNLLAFIGSLPAIDIPQIIDRPAITPPAFDNDACGVAAGELYERLLPPNGASDTDRVQAEFEARQFAESCRRYLPNFGSDACAQRAELNFARIFAQKRGHYYAAGLAKTAAEVGLPLCRQGLGG
ncbi:MAG: S8 family serine peptidase, partial [Gammaproteobacteria bacterium]|nr:S8 family serine peptidase [Gammaproteobacteria bacterium]